MSDDFLIDSNILVYAFDASGKEKFVAAGKFLKSVVDADGCFLSVQNLSEFHFAVTTKIENKLSAETSLETLREFSESFQILKYDEKTVFEAVNIQRLYKIPYWDALIAATMQENHIEIIYTENEKDFKKIPWLTVINPFK